MYDKNPPENGGFVSNLKHPHSGVFIMPKQEVKNNGREQYCNF